MIGVTSELHAYTSAVSEKVRVSCGRGYLAKGPRSGVGAEEATEAAGGAVLPAVGPAGQGAADLSQSIGARNIRLPQELCHVLPPPRLTLQQKTKHLGDSDRRGVKKGFPVRRTGNKEREEYTKINRRDKQEIRGEFCEG